MAFVGDGLPLLNFSLDSVSDLFGLIKGANIVSLTNIHSDGDLVDSIERDQLGDSVTLCISWRIFLEAMFDRALGIVKG